MTVEAAPHHGVAKRRSSNGGKTPHVDGGEQLRPHNGGTGRLRSRLYLLWRVFSVIPLLFIVSLVTFSLVYLTPGDPAAAVAGESATPQEVQAIRVELGLTGTFPEQFLRWLGHALTGNLGISLSNHVPVTQFLAERIPVTLTLTVSSTIVAIIVGGLLGILAAVKVGGWIDRLVTVLVSLGFALPSFWLGIILIVNFAVERNWLPAVGFVPFATDPLQWARSLILPVTTLAAAPTAAIARQLRSSMIDTLARPYIRTAQAGGLRRGRIVFEHALKNAAGPTLVVIGIQVSFMLGGSVVIENVFALPGLGQLAVSAVQSQDFPVIQGVVLVTAIFVLVLNLLIDLLQPVLNPKVRL